MSRLTAVDYDPFASGPSLTPVDYDPFAPTLNARASGSAGVVDKKAESIWGGSFDEWKKRKEAADAEQARMVAESEAGNVGSRRAQEFQRKVTALNAEGDITGDYGADSLRAGRSLEMGMEQGREQLGAGLQLAGETPLALADFFGRIRPKGEIEQDRANPLTEAGKDIRGAAIARQQEIAPLMIDRPDSLLSLQGAKYIAQGTLQSAPTTFTGLAAAVVNPAAGLSMMGAGSGAAKFADAREEDKNFWLAAEAGAAAAAAEVVPEMLPLGFLSGRLMKYLPGSAMKRMAATPAGRGALLSLSEGASEGVTELSNIAYEIGREGKTYTDDQIEKRLIDSMAIGTVMGAGMGGVAEVTGQGQRAYNASDIQRLELENSLRAAIKPRATTARILGNATPDAAAGAQIADDAFAAAGVGTVAAADIAEQDALARDLDAATRDQLASESEIDRLLVGNAPRAPSIPGAIPQGVQVSTNQDAFAAPGTIGGRDAPAPIQVTTLADRSVFVPGDPVAIRQKLAYAGSQWQGMAVERDGVPGVRFGRNAWPEVQGVVGGSVPATGSNREHGNGPGNTPMGELADTQSRDGYSAPRSPVASDLGLRTGPAGTAAPAAGVAGNASGTQPTQAAVAVDGRGGIDDPLPPEAADKAPVGAWVLSGIPDNRGRSVYQVRDIPIAEIVSPELDANGNVQPEKRKYVQGYTDRLNAGEQPPNLHAVEQEDGRIRLVDGHRRLAAARAAGRDTVRVLVGPLVDVPGEGKVPLTVELAQKSASTPAPTPPALRDLTDDERNFWPALTTEIRTSIDNPGGRMIVNNDGTVGRTKWADLGPMSGFWRQRPSGWNSDDVLTALDRAATGEKLSTKQRNIVEYAKTWVRQYSADNNADLVAYEQDSKAAQRESVRDDIESTLASVADTSPEQRASTQSLGGDYTAKLLQYKKDRRAWGLNPQQEQEYQDLLELDRETGKVGGRPMVGIGNKTAYVDALMQGKLMPVQVFLDADNFKALNDKFGHDVGDDAIRLIADVVRAEFGDGNVFHRGGDEFLTQGMTQEEVDAKMARVQDYLARVKMELPLSDGRTATLTGVGVSYGTGANEKAADDSLKQDKQRRKDAGLRFDRREGDDAWRVGSESAGAGTETGRTDSRDSSRAAAEGVGDGQPAPANDRSRPVPNEAESGMRGERGTASDAGTVQSIRAAISQALGPKFLARLDNQKWFQIVDSVADLPPDVRKSITGEGVAGFVLPDGRVFIVAEGAAANPVGVTLHELGVHYGMTGILGEDFAPTLAKFRRLRAKDDRVGRSYERATEAADKDANGELTEAAKATLDEEALAYFVEENWNKPDTRGIVAKVIDAIKSMLNRLGIPLSTLNASPEMLRKVAIGAARKAADGRVSVGKGGGLVYARDLLGEAPSETAQLVAQWKAKVDAKLRGDGRAYVKPSEGPGDLFGGPAEETSDLFAKPQQRAQGVLFSRKRDNSTAAEDRALDSGDLEGAVRIRNRRIAEQREALGDISNGVILKMEGRDSWAIVMPDVEGGGKWRMQMFDRRGFVGHRTRNSSDAALDEALQDKYTTRDDGALDEIQDSPEFVRGNFIAGEMMQLNAGKITSDEFDKRIADYDSSVKVVAKYSRKADGGSVSRSDKMLDIPSVEIGRGGRAPAGGIYVSDRFYDGGEFLPEEYPGGKSAARKLAAKVDGNIAELRVRPASASTGAGKAWIEVKMAGQDRFRIMGSSPFDSMEKAIFVANEIVSERDKYYQSRGVMPHPTEVTVAGDEQAQAPKFSRRTITIDGTERPPAERLFREYMRGDLAQESFKTHIARQLRGEKFDYEIRAVPVDDVTPSQFGEDYNNESSRETARRIADGSVLDARPEDVYPIEIDASGKIVDGNHRHAAAVMNGDKTILALVPVTSGSGKVINTGTFSPTDARIAYSRRTPAEARAESAQKQADLGAQLVVSPGQSFVYTDKFTDDWRGQALKLRERIQDKLLSVRNVQQDIEKIRGAIQDAMNVYRRENLMHGRVGDQRDKLQATHIKPLIEAMAEAKVSPALLEDYLEARHAKERNEKIAAIKGGMPDGASGMTTAQAEDFLQGRAAGHRSGVTLDPAMTRQVSRLARKVDAITSETRRRLLDSGQITQDTFDALENAYAFYVPLRGKDGTEGRGGSGTGKGIDVRGKPIKRAAGRGEGNRAKNILAEVVADAERSIINAEKGRVGRTLARLVIENPNPDVWSIEPVKTELKVSDGTPEEIYEAIKNLDQEPGTIIVKVKGKPYRIVIEDQRMAEALKNMAVETVPEVIQYVAGLNRYFSAVLTRYNPSFVGVNMTRDLLFGMTGIWAEHGTAAAAKAAASYFPAMRAVWRDIQGKPATNQMQRYAREYAEAGGKTYFGKLENVDDLSQRIGQEFKTFRQMAMPKALGGESSPIRALAKIARDSKMVQAIEAVNDTVENALRLSVYAARREAGASVEQAAEYAKNATVNFNRRGSATSWLNALYLFFNAGTQGAHRTLTLLKHRKVQGVLGGLAALQATSAMLLMGLDDEDGEPLWNSISPWDKQRNLILAIPIKRENGWGATVIKIPMPYGFNLFPYMGGRTVQLARDLQEKPVGRAIADYTTDAVVGVAQAMSPIPFDDGWKAALPHWVRIFTVLSENKDDLGIPIRAGDQYDSFDKPRSSSGRDDTPRPFKIMSTAMNRLGGGDDYTPPYMKFALDWAPEDLAYLFKTFSGGLGSNVVKSGTLTEKLIAGVPINFKDVPVLSAFVSNVDQRQATSSRYYEHKDAIEREVARQRDAAKQDGEVGDNDMGIRIARNKQGAKIKSGDGFQIDGKPGSLFDTYKESEKEIARIRNEMRAAFNDQSIGYNERIRRIDELKIEREEAQRELNAAWREQVRQRKQ